MGPLAGGKSPLVPNPGPPSPMPSPHAQAGWLAGGGRVLGKAESVVAHDGSVSNRQIHPSPSSHTPLLDIRPNLTAGPLDRWICPRPFTEADEHGKVRWPGRPSTGRKVSRSLDRSIIILVPTTSKTKTLSSPALLARPQRETGRSNKRRSAPSSPHHFCCRYPHRYLTCPYLHLQRSRLPTGQQ